jgi:glycosyltransferase involved in cell wall biosynthesis/protein-tyrosine-phosphatase
MMTTAPEAAPAGPAGPWTNDGEPLTVCHVFSGDLWAGAEVVIFNLLTSLREEPSLRVVALSLNEGELVDRLRAAGVPTHVVPETRHSLLALPGAAARALKGARVDVLHSHGYKQHVLSTVLAKRLGVTEIVGTLHGLPEPATDTTREARIVRWRTRLDFFVLRTFFSALVAVSDEMRRALVEHYGFREQQLRVIRNGGRFPSTMPAALSRGETFRIGTVGRLVPVKGFDLFLDVAAALRRTVPAVRFSILGDGPLREELARRVEELGLGDHVEFLSPRPDPFPYYRSLDLYLNTSRHEGLPLSVVEAMACGVPVVSAAVGGIPEVVADGEHGFLVTGREPAAFVERCVRLIADDRLRVSMSQRASAFARDGLSAPAMAAAYRSLYEECGARIRARRLRGIVRRAKGVGRHLIIRLETRRAERLRRRPAPLVQRLRAARRVLVLCQGNVIRSVMAAQLLASTLGERDDVAIGSAGLATEPGWRAHPRVVARCRGRRLDVSGHASVAVTAAMVAAADVVLVMDVLQLVTMTRRFPGARPRTFLLTTLASDVPMEIPDPMGKDDATVDACLDHVERAVKPLIGILAGRERS